MSERFGANHWRGRAEEARLIAEQMDDGDSHDSMLRIAAEYEKLADRAERARTAAANRRKNETGG